MIRVAVVDDQPLLVSAFAALIGNQPDMVVTGTGTNGHDAVELCIVDQVDVLLMDIRMPVMDGVEATRRIVDAGPRPRVLILTTFNIDALVLGAVAAGARGFLLKDADPARLLDAIRAVHRGDAVVDAQATPTLLEAVRASPREPVPLVEGLTPREIEVLTLIGHGRTNAEIGEELFIAACLLVSCRVVRRPVESAIHCEIYQIAPDRHPQIGEKA